MRPILATVSKSALAHNLAVVKQHAPRSKVMAVVKANGYGHGLFNVAQGLNAADGFAVLGLNEAIDLREAGYEQTLLLLEGVFAAAELNIATSYRIDIVVHSEQQIEMLEQTALIAPIHVHLKINTGMNRLGFAAQDFQQAYQRLQDCESVASITLMTHFATADEPIGIASALGVFNQAVGAIKAPLSLANSAAILRHPEAHMDWVRPGIMLYGASPVSQVLATDYGLKPVMQLTSELIAIQYLKSGDSVGYGHRFTASEATRIGVVACGYADGYPRHAPNGTPIAVAGKITRTLGRVSMDMLFVDLTPIPHAKIGTQVELWGSQVPVDAVAEASGTVGYELLCAVAPRVPMKVVD
jgi:alanine racemase